MTGIYFFLTGLALAGCLPLVIILYKQGLVKRLLAGGYRATARVYKVYKPIRSSAHIAYYQFTTHAATQAAGSLTTKMGVYKTGDRLEVYYHPDPPARNTVKGATQPKGLLIFGFLIALATLFMVYRLWDMIRTEGI
jgi:hypothetical protein